MKPDAKARCASDGNHNGADGDAPVGYGNPPREKRFKKGQSGNRRGRRKGEPNVLAVFKKVAREKVRVPVGGKTRIMTRAEYVMRVNYAAAIKKDQKAMNNMFDMADEAEQLVDRENAVQAAVPVAPCQAMSLEDFEALFGTPLSDDSPDTTRKH